MRHFLKIADGVDVLPVLNALVRQPELWDRDTFRTQFKDTPHQASDVSDVWLRFSNPSALDPASRVAGDNAPVWHDATHKLPQVKPIVLDLMRRVEAYELGRLLITRVRPGGRILPHVDDQGDYVHVPGRARYHVVLQGLPGSLFHCGDETACMLTGSVWWFNPFQIHSVENNSIDDRLHLLVDVTLWPVI